MFGLSASLRGAGDASFFWEVSVVVCHYMKILYIAADVRQVGGIEQYNQAFVAALRAAGAETRLLELKGRGVVPKLLFASRIIWAQVAAKPDLIACSHINFSPICLFVRVVFRTPYTISLYGIDAIGIKSALKLRALSLATRVVVISEYTKSLVLEQLPAIREKIFILPTAVDGERFFIKEKLPRFVQKYHLEGCPIILTVARLSAAEHKGYDRVMKALPLVLKEFPKAKYVLVGKGSDTRVDELLKNPLIKEHVMLTGRAEDDELNDYYNLADVFIMPSKFEGFAIVHKEALLCGKPVIASDEYGGREALFDGELGIAVPPEDIDAIANAILAVFRGKVSPHLLDPQWVRAKAMEHYGIQGFNARVKNLVHLLLARRP